MWIKADDKLAHHPKILRAGKLIGGKNGAIIALGFFHWCISYSAEYLTDGYLADEVIEGCALCEAPSRLAKCLSEAKVKPAGNGLLIRVDGGYCLHDYHDWNPSAEEARELIEAKRLAGRHGGLKSAESRKQKGKQNPSTCLRSASEAEGQAESKQSSSSRARDPVPSRPVQSKEEQKNGAAQAARPSGPVENHGPEPDKPNTRLIAAVLRKEGVLDGDDDVTDADLSDADLSDHDLEIRERAKESLAQARVPYDTEHIEAARDSERFLRRSGTRRGS